MKTGKFIVLEGTDGSGKGTQFELLKNRLIDEGHQVATFDFPQYGEASAYFVEQYLNGKYGKADEVGPYKGSVFYALDRYAASFAIRQATKEGKIILCNRYVGSNMGHQGAKISNEDEKMKYFLWLEEFEFNIMGIPRPDLNIVLHVPAETAYELVAKKQARSYIEGGKTRDIHEADIDHLKKSEQVYLQICNLFPDTFTSVSCVKNGKLLAVEEIADEIWKLLKPQI